MPASMYTPPLSRQIAESQNKDDALRLLIAQRGWYSRAKVWQTVRWIGLLLIGIAAPVVSVIWPDAAVAMGAVAGVWLFVGRTGLAWAQGQLVTKAASVQEQFDFTVFGMPQTARRSALPSLEDIASVAGPDNTLRAKAGKENLFDWYPVNDSDPGAVTVAIAQRSNAAYSDRLLRKMSTVWIAAAAAWFAALIVVSSIRGLSLASFLVGIALPVLPAALDVVEYVAGISRAATERADLANTIEARLADSGTPIGGSELLVWQERMFELRRSTIQVPDWLYKLLRGSNESAMHAAAGHLSRASQREAP